MSKVPTLVLATDGYFYEDPVFRGELNGSRCFICFDDEDPPEIVIETRGRNIRPSDAASILSDLGFKHRALSKNPSLSERCFSGKFHKAAAFDFEIHSPIPVPTEFDSRFKLDGEKQDRLEGRYYAFGTPRRKSR